MHSLRRLLAAPSFLVPAVAGLALAIGASTTVFSVFSAMLLHSMGFRDVSRLVAVWQSDPAHGQKQVEASYNDWKAWQSATGVFQDVALASSVNLDFPLFAGGQPEHVDGTTVTGNFFQVLGATPFAGRLLTPDDDHPGAPFRVVLAYGIWKSRFGGDYGVLGKEYRTPTGPAIVVGIARPEFDFPRDVAMWAPLLPSFPGVEKNGDLGIFRAVARLQDGVTADAARSRLATLARQREKAAAQFTPTIAPMLDEVYGAARPAVWILFGAVLLVLLVACANTANLLLARAADRRREFAIRMAVGAGRQRIVGLLLGEAAMLAGGAAAAGLLLAKSLLQLVVRLAPPEVPRIAQATLDLPVLAFGIGLASLTVLLFGLGPALLGAQADPIEALNAGGTRLSAGRSQTSARRFLIAGEAALAAFLLVGAGLLVHSFAKMAAVDPGFRPEHILTFRITTEVSGQPARRNLYTDVLEKLRALPGVESAAAVLIRPLSGTVGWDTTYAAEGQAPVDSQRNPNGNYEAISAGYFRTMGIRLMAGRDFTAADGPDAAKVVIINEATARKHWPQGDAVGRRIRVGGGATAPLLTVVGVAADVRYREWEAARPDFYVPYLQRAQHRTDFVVKTHGDPSALSQAVRRAVLAVNPEQPVSNVTTMDMLVDQALARSRFNGAVLGALALCAILLAGIGIYGVLSYSLAQRAPEIGIRAALGATPRHILGMVMGESARLVGVGLAAGLIAAAFGRDLLRSQLFGVSSLDPAAFGGAAAALLLFGLLATLAPALRASARSGRQVR